MAEPRRRKSKSTLRRRTIRRLARQLRLAMWVTAALAGLLIILAVWRREPPSPPATPTAMPAVTGTVHTRAYTPTPTRRPTLTPSRARPSPIPTGKRVGILAGHLGPQNDPGAVCPDGPRELDINLAVAERVVAALRDKGHEVDLLEEFDDRLEGYRADAFLSIHSDSCDIPEATGFKVAHVANSAIPDIEDRLVECLYREYERATGLPRHDSSITPAMHGYHAFREIAPQTPGAIIELGFMGADQHILTNEPDRLAAGIVNGLNCFLESSGR